MNTHIEVKSEGAYGDYMQPGQLLKITQQGDRFFWVETFDKQASFKVSVKTNRACDRDGAYIPTHKQPVFTF